MKNKNGKHGILFLLLAFALVSCATDISDMEISKVSLSIRDMHKNHVNTLLPDTQYELDFRVTDLQGEEYINPNYRDFQFTKLDKLKLVTYARFNVTMKTDKQTFHEPGTMPYSFTLSVKDNPYPVKKYAFPLNWNEYDTIDYSGEDGENGEEGNNGDPASGASQNAIHGESGKDGEDGEDGFNGHDITLIVTEYQYKQETKLLFYEPKKSRLFLTDKKPITIYTSGGNGGKGGSGGNGGPGDIYVDSEGNVFNGSSGNPGDGGDGGNGGYGGDQTLISADSKLFSYLKPKAEGGKGGYGGSAGKVIRDGTVVGKGSGGNDGWDGRDGEVEYQTVEKEKIFEMLKKINVKGFSTKKVLYSSTD